MSWVNYNEACRDILALTMRTDTCECCHKKMPSCVGVSFGVGDQRDPHRVLIFTMSVTCLLNSKQIVRAYGAALSD